MTFAAVWRDAEAVADLFARRLAPGRVIVSAIGNRTAFISTFLACLRHRSILVPLDGDSTLAEALALVDRFRAPALIVRDAVDPSPEQTCTRPHERIALPNGVALLRFAHEPADAGFGDAVLFKLTSGSTWAPRAVMAAESNLVGDGRHIVEAMDIRPGDVNVAAIPMAHSYGLGNLVMPLVLQGSAIVLRDAFVPARLFDDIRASGATVMPGVPFMFDYIRRHLASAPFPRPMRVLITAGARLDAETLADFHRIFALKIHSFYGTSETGGIAYDASEEIGDPVTLGRRLPGVELSFREAAGAAEGEGRLHVGGAAVTRGYAGDEEATRESFVDGGFLTGDLGFEDDRGRLFLTGRVSRFINVAGRKVHPDEVARVLRAYPGVADARVFGMPDPARGQVLVACLVADPDRVDVVAVRRHCAAHLSAYKIPRQIVVLRALPVDARGKTDHRLLEALVARGPDPSSV
jgi:long-chain acyl-CoA synthetase